jgi:hypothetical protein
MKHFALAFALCSFGATLTGCIGGGGHGGGGQGLPTAVSVSTGNQTSLLQGQSLFITAVVMHSHTQNGSVTWSLSGTTCPNNCGSLNSSTANPVTYTAPQTVNATFSVTVTATSVADPTAQGSVTLNILAEPCPSGNEAVLNGQYAFMVQGTISISPSAILAVAGSFTANGAGSIAGGLQDVSDSFHTLQVGMSTITKGSYSVGADNRGCLTLTNSNNETITYRFALGAISSGVATKGRIIEFDDSSGAGIRSEGILRRQDPASFSQSSLVGNYVFALVGADLSNGHPRSAWAGVVNESQGQIHSGEMDTNVGGTVSSITLGAGGLNVAANGRGTFILNAASGAGGGGGVLYMVSSQEIFALTSGPIQIGEFFQQAQSSFSDTALNGNVVLYTSGLGSAGPDVSIGSFTFNGTGNYTGVLDSNTAGAFMPLQSFSGAYSVDVSGRTTTGKNTPIFYLTNSNTGVILGLGPTVEFGYLQPQAAGPLSNATVSGMFSLGTDSASAANRPIISGAISFDGVGSYMGTEDQSTPTGLSANVALSNTYSFSATASTPGRGTLDSAGNTVAYIITPSKLVFFDKTAAKPSLTVVEK